MKFHKRLVALSVMMSIVATTSPMTAYASMISTDTIVSSATAMQDRQKVADFLQREDIRQALQDKGVSYDAAQARIDAMSDSEVAQLANKVDEAPVGGDILGIAFAVFIILLITDIFGLTKVFPFTRSVR